MSRNVKNPDTESKTISLKQAMEDVKKLSSEDKEKLYSRLGKMFKLKDLENQEENGMDSSITEPILKYHAEEGSRGKTKRKRKKRKHKKPKRKTRARGKSNTLVNEQFNKSLKRKDISPTYNLPPIVPEHETIEYPTGPYGENDFRMPEKIALDNYLFNARAELDDDNRKRKRIRELPYLPLDIQKVQQVRPGQILKNAEPRVMSPVRKTRKKK